LCRGEVVAAEEGLEDRPGDEVLGEHLDGVAAGDAVVEVAAQAGEEPVELRCDSRLPPSSRAVIRVMCCSAISATSLAQVSQ
jgi:hypothetical protein